MTSNPVRAMWSYIGGDKVTSAQNGVTSTQVTTMPGIATIVELRANGGDTYFEINGTGFTSTDVPGFVADGSGEIIGPLDNLDRLDVFTDGGGSVHLMFFTQHGSWR